ncbi:alpha-L-rhamnosidase [Bifidobacterium vespertilionis]|nr:alpha-L-rhamnosidase [Bifidobacterium vespertilionis]
MSASTGNQGRSDITDVRIEHFDGDAIGIGTGTPRISWRYDPQVGDLAGRKAQIRMLVRPFAPVGSVELGRSVELDQPARPVGSAQSPASVAPETYDAARGVVCSAIVPAEANVLHPWPFDPVASGCRVTVSVRLLPESELAGPDTGAPAAAPADPADPVDSADWSPSVAFEPGLIDPARRVAHMVGPDWPESAEDARGNPVLRRPGRVRASISLRDRPVAARLYLSAYGLVGAEVNGRPVGDDILTPGWTDYRTRFAYRTFDVTGLLCDGVNGLGFWLGDGWYRGRIGFGGGKADCYGDRLGVWAQLRVAYADGSEEIIASNAFDGRWEAKPGPIVSSGLYEGESYDARLEEPGWSQGDADASAAGWTPVRELPFDNARLFAPSCRGVERYGEPRKPMSVKALDGGSYLLDFGQNCTQRLQLRIPATEPGHVITVHHAEVLNPDGSLAVRPLRRAVQIDSYTSNGKAAVWEPRFTIHGFRYARIDGWPDAPAGPDAPIAPTGSAAVAAAVESHVYTSAMPQAGSFDCSDAALTRLHRNVEWSMRSNFVSIPTDCPQRDERFGWTGDIAVFAPTAEFLAEADGFLSDWLDDVASETAHWGTVPYYVPYPYPGWGQPQAVALWGDAATMVPWALYMSGGDVDQLRRQYPLARRWVDEVVSLLASDGVWDRRPEVWCGQLGDWLDPTAPPDDAARAMTQKELVATAFTVHSLDLAARMATVLGDGADASRYRSLAAHVREGFRGRFVHEDGSMTSDTQCAYCLAIVFDLFDGGSDSAARRAFAGDRLAQLVRDNGYTVGTGFAGTPYVLRALLDTGHADEAFRLLTSRDCPSWLYQVSMGATTTWERWDSMLPNGEVNPGDMTSFNHYALGSVADWMHAAIGGLRPAEPGWSVFEVAPVAALHGIDAAECAHMTPNGLASVKWRRADDGQGSGGSVDMELIVPANTIARVRMGGDGGGAGRWRELPAGHHRLTIPLTV